MAITKLQPFNLDATANYTFANVTASNVNGANLVSANYITGTLTTNAQPNITSVGTLTSLAITGNVTSGNANLGNLVTANFFTGNGSLLTSITGANVTGNVGNALNAYAVAGANVSGQVTFAATANSVAGANVSGQVANALVAGTVYTNAQPNITSVGTLTSLGVNGTVTAVAFTANTGVFTGNGNGLSSIVGANVTGTVSSATTAGTVTTADQPNITSVGSLTGLTVSNATGVVNFTTTANVTLGAVANLHISGGTTGQYLSTDGSGILSWSTVTSGSTSNISNGNSNVNIPSANGNVNISAVGNANILIVTGTGANINGTLDVTGNANVSNLNVSGNIVDTTGTLSISTSGGTNGNLALSADGTGRILLDGMAWPLADGTANYVLQTDGLGSLSWAAQSGGGGGGASISNGTSNVNIATANGNVVVGVGGTSNVAIFANTGMTVAGNFYTGSGSGGNITGANIISANVFVGNISVLSNAQPNITSLGSLTGLTVSNATGVVDFVTTGNVTLGSISNLHITGGTSGFGLVTDGSGALSFANITTVLTNNNTVNATYYPMYATVTSGNLTVAGISSTKMQFNPSLGQLTVTDLNTTSDAVLKNNVESIDDPITVIRQLFGVGFNWVDTGKKSYGLIAQMLEKVLPELVNVNEQGTKTVSYIPIIAFLIEAIKKQQDDIDMLKSAKR